MKIGKVLSAEPVEGSAKLLKLSVDFGETEKIGEVGEAGAPKPRQVVSGIAKDVKPEDLIGKLFPFVTNLPPRAMMGIESQAMIMVTSDEQGITLLSPTREVAPGSKLS
jgi:methionyl-tRNA synthetase